MGRVPVAVSRPRAHGLSDIGNPAATCDKGSHYGNPQNAHSDILPRSATLWRHLDRRRRIPGTGSDSHGSKPVPTQALSHSGCRPINAGSSSKHIDPNDRAFAVNFIPWEPDGSRPLGGHRRSVLFSSAPRPAATWGRRQFRGSSPNSSHQKQTNTSTDAKPPHNTKPRPVNRRDVTTSVRLERGFCEGGHQNGCAAVVKVSNLSPRMPSLNRIEQNRRSRTLFDPVRHIPTH
jgi:hypothetical protein